MRSHRYAIPAPHGPIAIVARPGVPLHIDAADEIAQYRALDVPTVNRLDAFRRDQHLYAARASLIAAGLSQGEASRIMDEVARLTEAQRDPVTAPEAIAGATDGSLVGWRKGGR